MNSTHDLAEKVALVSGSSRGIGKKIAYHLLSGGAKVYLTGRSQEDLDQTYNSLSEQFPDQVCRYLGDLSNTVTIAGLLKTIHEDHGHIDIVVANIGSGRSQSGWDVPDNLWEESMQINFLSAVRLSRESLRYMTEAKSGSIIFIASVAGVETIAAPVPYACAKAALLSYMKNTAPIAARYGIRMNAVSPGNVFFPGGTWDKKMRENPEQTRNYIRDTVPLQRFGTPDDIGSMVRYLASDAASFITGADFVVDGGQTRSL
ncbi:SDR family oxidoreductase [uncultured Methanoregula sp.]|uniref:SDR family NAD(P)-dependent oxidoreductase n=1 Tax=uncultured Methanoregula sp. TaxID=1005933 RepID=UPI002AAB2D96|nr:SDR family oxidoreductase [uncultured Methanoregula sp.]